MTQDIDFKQVPHGWLLCYVSECPRKATCLRYQACLEAPSSSYFHQCVMPSVLKQPQCPAYRPMQKTQVAIGFRHIFKDVKASDITRMRSELMDFLGSPATFYRYRNGSKPLNPRQQQWIQDMFRRHGYSDDIAFDEVKDMYIFD